MNSLPFLGTRLISFALLSLLLIFTSFACAKRAREPHAATTAQPNNQQSAAESSTPRININIASAKELEMLPTIGKGLSERIIEHREKYGPFRRSEHVLVVRGISDRRFRALRNLITVE